jgi:hypothetical protein
MMAMSLSRKVARFVSLWVRIPILTPSVRIGILTHGAAVGGKITA